MNRLPSITSKQLVAALKRAGFSEDRQKGSHLILLHPDGRRVTVPMHKANLKRPTLKEIVKMAGLGEEEIQDLL